MSASKKRIYRISLSALFFVLSLPVLSAMNDMNIIPFSSPIYEYMDSLYILEGHAATQGARPWTNADLKQQLTRI